MRNFIPSKGLYLLVLKTIETMYRGFKLNIDESTFCQLTNFVPSCKDFISNKNTFYDCLQTGDAILNKTEVHHNIKKYVIGESGVINGTKLQNDWFPQINCDVFISHSHRDEKVAIALAGWLYKTFGLTSFIDSCIWGYANDLLKDIDNEYCRNNNRSYNYNRRNYSTSHVHMMLNMALMQMIDKTECLFFLNTPNSICLDDIETSTLSPWIYSEIGISQIIEKTLKRKRTFTRRTTDSSIRESIEVPDFKYKLNLEHLAVINHSHLNNWAKCNKKKTDALDYLYNHILPAPKKE